MDFSIIFKIIVFYLFVVVAYRLINRQELRELTIADGIIFVFAIQLMIEVILNNNHNILIVVIPVLVLILLRPALKMINSNKILNNNKVVVVKDGKINFSEITKTKYSLYNLINELQSKGIDRIEDVKMAFLDGGKLIINKQNNPLPLIFNGSIDYQTLVMINKTPNWLLEILDSKNLSLDNIYYSFYIDDRVFIIQKDL